MSDSIWQHNVTKGTIPPPKKTSYFDLIYIYIYLLNTDAVNFQMIWWSLVIFEPGSNSIGSSLYWSPSSFGYGQAKLILVQCVCQLPCHSGESHVFFSHHLLHMDSLQQIPCIEWNKGQRPWQFFLHAEQQWGNPSSHNHWSQCPQVPTPSHIETLLWGCRTSARKGQHEQHIMNGST